MIRINLKITVLVAFAITVVAAGCSKDHALERFDTPAAAGLPAKPHASKGAIAAGSSWGSGWMEFQPKIY